MTRICVVPKVSGVGGMVSFQAKMTAGLERRGIKVVYQMKDHPYDAILVTGGTRNLAGLWQARRKGVRIVQRLDGMNWLHRLRPTGLRHYLRSEYGNLVLNIVRKWLVDHVVYQSRFSQDWWERVHGLTPVPASIVHNGVDLSIYSPEGTHQRPIDRIRVLMVEGNLGGGYELGLEIAVQLRERLAEILEQAVELMIVGQVDMDIKQRWSSQTGGWLSFIGQVRREQIPAIDRSAHFLYAADVNAACPNSVIEAMACGLPILAFDTGALVELVTAEAGQIVPYGGNPWKLDFPDILTLAQAAVQIVSAQPRYRVGARAHAETAFGIDSMVDGYLKALMG